MRAKRIGIDARPVYDHFPGIGRAISGLLRGLSELQPEQQFVVLRNSRLPNTRHRLDYLQQLPQFVLQECSQAPFGLAEQLHLPAQIRQLQLDLFHSPYYVKPYVPLNCPSVVTIYDLIGRHFPEQLSRRGRLLFELATRLAIRSATRIITCSEHTRADLCRLYHVAADRISVVPLGVGPEFRPSSESRIAELRQRKELPARYLLYVGANKPHKNLQGLLQIWAQLQAAWNDEPSRPQLVVAGHRDTHGLALAQLVYKAKLDDSVMLYGEIDEADLATLYSGAEIFVFPSRYEGFGLPVLEAMACGTPVVCSNQSSLPEVAGTAALLANPDDPAGFVAALQHMLSDPNLRTHYREAGLQHACRYTWRHCAAAALDVYETSASYGRPI